MCVEKVHSTRDVFSSMIRLDKSSFFTDNNYNKNAEKVYFAELTGTRHLTCHKSLQKRCLLPSLTSGVMAKTTAKILREATLILQSLLLHKNKRLMALQTSSLRINTSVGRRGTLRWGRRGAQYRNTVRKNSKYRNHGVEHRRNTDIAIMICHAYFKLYPSLVFVYLKHAGGRK